MNAQKTAPKYFAVFAGTVVASGLAVLFGLQEASYLSALLTFLFSLPVFCGAFYFPFSQLFFKMKTSNTLNENQYNMDFNHDHFVGRVFDHDSSSWVTNPSYVSCPGNIYNTSDTYS